MSVAFVVIMCRAIALVLWVAEMPLRDIRPKVLASIRRANCRALKFEVFVPAESVRADCRFLLDGTAVSWNTTSSFWPSGNRQIRRKRQRYQRCMAWS